MTRKYPKLPIVGVAAVIFLEEAVLLARRKQDPGRGQWSLAGGVVELGETLLEALDRELWEEAAIKIKVGGLIDVFDRIIRDRKKRIEYHYVLVDYWGWILSGQPMPGSDVSELRLITLRELENFGIGDDIKETIWKAFEMRKHIQKSIE